MKQDCEIWQAHHKEESGTRFYIPNWDGFNAIHGTWHGDVKRGMVLPRSETVCTKCAVEEVTQND